MFAFVIHLPYKHTKFKKNHLIINWQVKGHNSINKQRNRIGARTSNWSSSPLQSCQSRKTKTNWRHLLFSSFNLYKHRHTLNFHALFPSMTVLWSFYCRNQHSCRRCPFCRLNAFHICVVFSLKIFFYKRRLLDQQKMCFITHETVIVNIPDL